MTGYLEIWETAGSSLIALSDRMVIGREPDVDVPLAGDEAVSRAHAIVERVGPGWSVRDLGSTNGTFVNGARLQTERVLQSGDEIRIGRTRLLFRPQEARPSGTVRIEQAPPEITRRERDVLLALCRPLAGPQSFPQPATITEIAEEVFLSSAAVKYHLSNLYTKFGLLEPRTNRRAELANVAMASGAVSLHDLAGD